MVYYCFNHITGCTCQFLYVGTTSKLFWGFSGRVGLAQSGKVAATQTAAWNSSHHFTRYWGVQWGLMMIYDDKWCYIIYIYNHKRWGFIPTSGAFVSIHIAPSKMASIILYPRFCAPCHWHRQVKDMHILYSRLKPKTTGKEGVRVEDFLHFTRTESSSWNFDKKWNGVLLKIFQVIRLKGIWQFALHIVQYINVFELISTYMLR